MLTCKYSKFSLPKNVTYLNCAYMSPMMKSVEKEGVRSLRRKRNPIEITPNDFFTGSDLLRQEYAKLINAEDAKRIAIIPSVSYGISTVAKNLSIAKGENIVVAAEQFPSNYYPWQRLCLDNGAELVAVAPEKTNIDRGKKWNEKILSAINSKTKAVAIANTHWADGTKFDLVAIRKRTRDVNALLIIDGTQSVGALPFDVQKIQPDALICAGYKWLLGPYSIGVGYFASHFNEGKPLEENWINRLNSEDFTGLVSYQPEYQAGALRYDMGERSNFTHVAMLSKSIAQLNRWHVENIQAYCKHITTNAIETLKGKGFWVEDEAFRGSHLFGVRMPAGMDIEKVKQSFLKNRIYVSFRGDAMRVAPNVYNDESDLKKLVKVLTSHLK